MHVDGCVVPAFFPLMFSFLTLFTLKDIPRLSVQSIHNTSLQNLPNAILPSPTAEPSATQVRNEYDYFGFYSHIKLFISDQTHKTVASPLSFLADQVTNVQAVSPDLPRRPTVGIHLEIFIKYKYLALLEQ